MKKETGAGVLRSLLLLRVCFVYRKASWYRAMNAGMVRTHANRDRMFRTLA